MNWQEQGLLPLSDAKRTPSEAPTLEAQSQIHSEVQFLGIAKDDRLSSQRFMDRYRLHYPQLQAPHQSGGFPRRLADPHGSLPFMVMLDTRHRICAKHTGEVDAQWVAAAVQQRTDRK